MFEFFMKIGNLIEMVINFVITMIESLIQLFIMVPKSYAAIVEVLGLMPPFIVVPIYAVLGFAMIIVIVSKFT